MLIWALQPKALKSWESIRMSSAKSDVATRPQPTGPVGQRGFLRLVALFKFCKAALLLAVGLGALGLLRPSASQRVHEWAASLAESDNGGVVQQFAVLASGLTPSRLVAFGIAAFLLAGLFTTEGWGLWFGKRWAEYLTVIATLSLVPLEVFELTRRTSVARFSVLALNLAVVVYLIYHLRRRRAGVQISAGSAA